MPHNTQGFLAICQKAAELGWPEVYRDDLRVHDARVLMDENAPQEFGFGIRSTGTDLFIPGSKFYLELALGCQKYRPKEQLYFWYDGEKLLPTSIEGLIEKMKEAEVNHANH